MNHDPQMFVELTAARSPLEVEAIVAALRAEGIEAIGFNHAAAMLSGLVAPFTVSVHRENLERARAVLAQIKADSAEVDWDELDVGEMPEEVRREMTHKLPGFPRRATKPVLYSLLFFKICGVVLGLIVVAIVIWEVIRAGK